jgi:hypothetical protein
MSDLFQFTTLVLKYPTRAKVQNPTLIQFSLNLTYFSCLNF